MIPDGKFIEKLIANFTVKFVDFFFENGCCCFFYCCFLVTDITEFSSEAKETCKGVNTAKFK